ncbi:MAG: hypothetical protein HXX80_00260 [Nitrososphaerales archaeon]|nr:hypothetical protein [Nitrososphaerales archaeon]
MPRRCARVLKQRTAPCPNCGLRTVTITVTKAVPGKHYNCDRCGHEWQDRTVRRYRQRKTLFKMLLGRVLERKGQLNPRDRFFLEKIHEQGKSSLEYHSRLLRIAHKVGIDFREQE